MNISPAVANDIFWIRAVRIITKAISAIIIIQSAEDDDMRVDMILLFWAQ